MAKEGSTGRGLAKDAVLVCATRCPGCSWLAGIGELSRWFPRLAGSVQRSFPKRMDVNDKVVAQNKTEGLPSFNLRFFSWYAIVCKRSLILFFGHEATSCSIPISSSSRSSVEPSLPRPFLAFPQERLWTQKPVRKPGSCVITVPSRTLFLW